MSKFTTLAGIAITWGKEEANSLTLDEAIDHAKEVAKNSDCEKCREEHLQLVKWLDELKIYHANGDS